METKSLQNLTANQKLVNIFSLAEELLELLFTQSSLTFEDIKNLSKTCKRFYLLTKSDKIWRGLIQSCFNCQPKTDCCCYQQFKHRYINERKVKRFIHKVTKDTYSTDGIPDKSFQPFHQFFGDENKNLNILLDILYSLAYKRYQTNLTQKFYAEKLHQYVYLYHLKLKWIKLLDLHSVGSQTELEEGAILISRWNNPTLTINKHSIKELIDSYAELVKQKVSTSWLDNTLLVDSAERSRRILAAINIVFYKDLKFIAITTHNYYIGNSFVDRVLETHSGYSISLAIIYMSIARRLGLNVEGVNFPGHFLIKITVKTLTGEVCNYIDCFKEGKSHDEASCMRTFLPNVENINPNYFEVADKTKIFIKMAANIIQSSRYHHYYTSNLNAVVRSLKLILLLDPDNNEARLLMSKLHIEQGINLQEVVENLQSLSNHGVSPAVLDLLVEHASRLPTENRNTEVKLRSKYKDSDIQYRVGMVMANQSDGYLCVIYGWDHVCCMSRSWKVHMGVYNLSLRDKQPFYHVLSNDGANRYAAQENLTQHFTGVEIMHTDIGKYFDRFCKQYYSANEVLNEHYPEDQPFPKQEESSDHHHHQSSSVTVDWF